MNRLLPILLLALLSTAASGQNPEIKRTWHWYFGDKAGLDFSGGTPIALTNSAMHAWEGVSSISDLNGNLLFYTDGDTVWNKNHLPMPNGRTLINCPDNNSTQGALIVPQPKSDSLFYIFTTDCGQGNNSFRYSIVNLSLIGGLGDVTTKNKLLFNNSSEKVAAVHHSNGCDIWIACQQKPDKVYTYLITETGLDTLPVDSFVAGYTNLFEDGYLKFSPDGSMLGSVYHWGSNDTIDIYDFNNSTGAISTQRQIPFGVNEEAYGLTFSPDNSKLYVNTLWVFNSFIYQLDVSTGNQAAIIASKTLINSSANNIFHHAMQIAPDGKIYVARLAGNQDSIAVINNPNASGLGCNFVSAGVFLLSGKCWAGLPNFLESWFDPNLTNPCNTGLEENEHEKVFTAYPNPAGNWLFIEALMSDPFDLTIYGMLGQQLWQMTDINKPLVRINLNGIPAGLLFVEIKAKQNQTITKKIYHENN